MRRIQLIAVTFLSLASTALATYPSGFSEAQVVTGISNPTAMAFAPDGRIFVCEQGGALRVVKNGALLPTPFLTVSVDPNGERGLLGVAFHPNFGSNNFVYVYYTVPGSPVHNRLSRFTANGDVVVPGSELPLLELNNLSTATNHNGGAIHFGIDGKLYVAVGDNANGANSQSFSTRLGKILRLNDDGAIPGDNPYFSSSTVLGLNKAIWALGLRNPFTFSFHPINGRMHINDVGQNTWEEVNLGAAGANYGWQIYEGFDGGDPNYTDPLIAYAHTTGTPTGCAITGGAFYTGVKYPTEYADNYFYADFCSQFIYRLTPPDYTAQIAFATGLGKSAVDLQLYNGDLYYLARDAGGSVYRIERSLGTAPSITIHPVNQTVSVNQTATFTVAASGDTPLNYQWQRNGVNISGAPNSPSYTTPATTLADNGAQFRSIVSNAFGSATSNAATLTVVTNQLPTASIDTPAAGTRYTFDQTISFSGSASDPDQTLPDSAFNWKVEFHHDTHFHPHVDSIIGRTGSFQTNFAETSANVFYRLILTVTDSAGAQSTVVRDILPRTSTLRLQSNPGGMRLRLDGDLVTSSFTFTGVVGQPRTIEAVSPQVTGNRTYNFQSWSDGGARIHTIQVPASATTFTAKFQKQ